MTTCQDCQKEVYCDYNMVVLPNYIWLTIAKTHDMLCDLCIEARLGRKLTINDFPDYPVEIYRNNRKHNVREIWCNNEFFKQRGIKFKCGNPSKAHQKVKSSTQKLMMNKV